MATQHSTPSPDSLLGRDHSHLRPNLKVGNSGYRAGCRCHGCCEGMRSYARQVYARVGKARRKAKQEADPGYANSVRERRRLWMLNRRREDPEYRSRVYAGIARRHQERRQKLDEIKLASGCVDCGYKAHAVALDFDHVRGEKSFTISYMICRSWKAMAAEIAKCDVVCSNCHRVRTHVAKSSGHRKDR